MRSFLELQGSIPFYKVICEGETSSNCKVKLEFRIEALNENVANEKSDTIAKELNLKNINKSLIKL